jgi:hypothetical protein
MRIFTKYRIVIAGLVTLNLGVYGIRPTGAATVDADGYGECFQEVGTTACDCVQLEFHDCDLCDINPCGDVWPEYCERET